MRAVLERYRVPRARALASSARRWRARRDEAIWAYVLILPWLIGFVGLTLAPIVATLLLSLTDYRVFQPELTRFVGLQNYRTALVHDASFRTAVRVTAYYCALAVPLDLIAGLALALLLNTRVAGVTVFRTIYYIPSLISGVVLSLLFLWVFQPQFGLANALLEALGLPRQQWIYSTRLVIPSLALMSVWGVGRTMIVFLAALQGIPTELYESAQIDGAGPLAKLFAITLPMISPAIFFNLVLDVIADLQIFTAPFVITKGGPAEASLFYVLYLYRSAFEQFRMGYACALAWLLFLAIMALTAIIFRSGSIWVYYEGGRR